MHVDTGHNFPEVIEFRDRRVARAGRAADRRLGAGVDRRWPRGRGDRHRRVAQPPADHDAARRDRRATGSTPRSAARAATRSGRGRRSACSRSATTSASGTRRASGPSCGASTTPRVRKGEHVRVFPLSNWTELDVWRYIHAERLEVPSIYYAHDAQRDRPRRDAAGRLRARAAPRARGAVRGDGPLPDGGRHGGDGRRALARRRTLEEVVREIAATRVTERGETRADDRVSVAAMEDRKREGYF